MNLGQDALRQISESLKTLDQQQVRILTGTVVGPSTVAATIPVRLDNDGSASLTTGVVTIPSVIGLLETGARVSILTVPPAGMIIVGIINADFNIQSLWDYQVLVTNNGTWIIRRFYTSSTVWNKPTSPLFLGVNVRIQSGGGGSGGTAAASGETSCSAGGQGGGYVEGYTLASLLDPAPATIIVGAGGPGGAAGNNAGSAGLNSWFISGGGTTELTIGGGAGGAGGGAAATGQTTQAGGSGAQAVTATNFDVRDVRQGDDGGQGFRIGVGDTGVIWPGFGGGSRMGAQTRIGTLVTSGAIDNKQIAPIAGWPFGGGASGRGVNDYVGGSSVAASAGAAGADGCVIVEEIYRT